jgi:serine O-acetyltransferase
LQLVDQTRAGLIDYTCAQVAHLIPDGRSEPLRAHVAAHVDEALERVGRCIDAVRMWRAGEFSHLHSSQYCIYLYYLANSIWRNTGETAASTRLFLLNKALNGIDLFYEIEMPKVFFIGHSVGIVLAKATYGERLVLYQNSTVGKNHGVSPVLGEGVVMYPNTAVIGRCTVGDRTVISQGTGVVNRDTPGDCMVFPGPDGGLAFKPAKHDIVGGFFR